MKRILLLSFAFLTVIAFSAMAQRTVSGKVTDDTGEALPGVNVVIKGTTTGVTTDLDGNYRLSVDDGATLVFSYVGFETQEVQVGARTTIDVTLGGATELQEVVVTAQGIQREAKALGYSVGQVDDELIETRPQADVSQILRGKIPGVDITAQGGFLGRQTNIIIRGQSSVNGNNQPLFIVDGVFYDQERYIDIDPNNIANVNVLKGLAASSLYGQEGRNGVILITTKTGQKGNTDDLSISVQHQFIWNEISNLPDFQNTYGQGSDNNPNVTFVGNWGGRFDDNFTVPGHYATGRVPGLDVLFPELQGDVPYQAFPNNVSDFFDTNTGSITSLVANARMGKTNVGFAFSHNSETGYIAQNNIEKTNFTLSANTEIAKNLTMDASFQYSNTIDTRPTFNFFDRLLYLPRNLDIQGLPFESPVDNSSVFYRPDLENPRWQLKNTAFSSDRDAFFGKVGFTYSFLDKFSVGYRLGVDSYTTTNLDTRNKGGVVDQAGTIGVTGTMQTFNTKKLNLDQNFLLTASNVELSSDLKLNAQVGLNIRSFLTERFGIFSSNQVVYGFFRHENFVDHLPGTDALGRGNQDRRTNIIGLYGQAELGYRDYLFLTLVGRNDWGSQVESENQSLFYPSASVSFVPTDAFPSLKSNTLSFLKVRAGYGTSAGYPSPFLTRPTLAANSQAFFDESGTPIAINSINSFLPNPDLRPEQLQEIEVGANAKMFNGVLDIDLSLYKRISEDQVLQRSLPNSTGFSSTFINAGRIDTEGIELGLTVVPIETSDFRWSLVNNFTAYETTAVDLPEEFINFANGLNYAIEGQPLGVFRLDYTVRDDEGNRLINPADGTLIGSEEAGLPDKVIGDPNPDWKYTLINGVSYKGLNLTVQLEYTHGGDIFSFTASNLLRRGVTKDTEDREGTFIIPGVLGDPATGEPILDENGNKIPNRIQLGANDLYFLNIMDISDNIVYDGSVIRIREINLAYRLPATIMDRTPFESATLSFNVQNLWYNAPNFPEHMNFDPEVSSQNQNGRGFDTQSDPSMRKFGAAIKVTL